MQVQKKATRTVAPSAEHTKPAKDTKLKPDQKPTFFKALGGLVTGGAIAGALLGSLVVPSAGRSVRSLALPMASGAFLGAATVAGVGGPALKSLMVPG